MINGDKDEEGVLVARTRTTNYDIYVTFTDTSPSTLAFQHTAPTPIGTMTR